MITKKIKEFCKNTNLKKIKIKPEILSENERIAQCLLSGKFPGK